MSFNVLISKDEEGIFVAECLDLPGCISDGKTKKEAIVNIKEAIEAYLESMEKHREELPSRKIELISINV
ncbi:MAG: type II toxin-antitoxin system HicB family antitoxin [archaeon]